MLGVYDRLIEPYHRGRGDEGIYNMWHTYVIYIYMIFYVQKHAVL